MPLPFRFAPAAERPFDVVGLGENSIDHLCVVPRLPGLGDKVRAAHYELQGGGQVATAMVACRRLGLRAKYVGTVGDDAMGRIALAELAREGVDTHGVRVQRDTATRLSFILIDQASGERTVVWDHDPRLRIEPGSLRREEIACARVLHVDATDVPAALTAARWAREDGVVTCIDIDHVPEGADELLGLIDLCIVSAGFPSELTGERDRERALVALRRWNPTGFLCMTLGAEGALALDGDRIIHAPAFAVEPVDTTACGDVFHGAFLYAALAGFELAPALRFANAAAALKTRALGGRPGIPTLAEVQAFLDQKP